MLLVRVAVGLVMVGLLSVGCRSPVETSAAEGPAVDSQPPSGADDGANDGAEGPSPGGGDGDGDTVGAIVPTPLVTGVATDFTGIDGSVLPAPSGSMELIACRWVDAFTWIIDAEWAPADGSTDEPVLVPVVIQFGVPPDVDPVDTMEEGPVGGYKVGVVALSEAGRFTVRLDETNIYVAQSEAEPGSWSAGAWAGTPPTGTCRLDVIADEEWSPGPAAEANTVDVMVDRRAGAVEVDPDTIEALAAAADPTDPDEPMLALLTVVGYRDVPVDRFFLSPTNGLTELEITNVDGCVTVVMSYDGVGTVRQQRDCNGDQERAGGAGSIFTDGAWTVDAAGDASFLRSISPYRFLAAVSAEQAPSRTGEPGGPGVDPAVDPDAALDSVGWGTEIGRRDWQDQRVGVFADLTVDHCCVTYEVEAAGATPFNGGSQGMACRDWSVSVHHDDRRGFALIVVEGDRSATVAANGSLVEAELESTDVSGLAMAVVDLPFDFAKPADHLSAITVYEPDGSVSSCVQSDD